MMNCFEDNKLHVSRKINSPLKREPVPIYREAGAMPALYSPMTSIQFLNWSPSFFPEAETQAGLALAVHSSFRAPFSHQSPIIEAANQ